VLVTLREQAIPGGVGATNNPTVPEKPDRAVILMVDVPVVSDVNVKMDGEDETVKSETNTSIDKPCMIAPLVPVMRTA